MPDLIDVLSTTGLRTGEVLPRQEIHRLGKHHRAIHLHLINPRDEVLLQRRADTVDHFPGLFGIAVTGHVEAGECSSQAVRRELEEELGVEASSLRVHFMFSFFQEAVLNDTYIDRQFNDVYVARADLDLARLEFDRSEVAELRFVPFERFRTMATDTRGDLAPVYADECRDLTYFLHHLHG